MDDRSELAQQEAELIKNYISSQVPKRRRRGGAKQCFIVLLLLIAVGVLYVALNPWAFFMGGNFHPLGYWQGYGRMHSATAGDYFLYVYIHPYMRRSSSIVPSTPLSGDAYLCTPKGERFYLRLGGSMPWGYYVNSLGKSIHVYTHKYRTFSPDDRPNFDLYGHWGQGELVADDHKTLSTAFLPDGTLRPKDSRVPPSQIEDIQTTLREGTYSEFKAACANARR